MPILIKLNDMNNGHTFFFNADNIYTVRAIDGGSRIWDKEGEFLDVEQLPEQIDLMIDRQIRNVVDNRRFDE